VSSARLKELLVLGVLRAHPLHGYALLQAVEQGLGPAAGLMRSATYAILKRLQERRWITSRREKAGAYPEREVYRVTRAGERAFAELLDGLMSRAVPVGTQPLAVLLAHVDELDASRRREQLESRATPPPGTMPSSTAARVACRASSTRAFFSFISARWRRRR
jgi:DNA-binding PadR family transcriptional regulator